MGTIPQDWDTCAIGDFTLAAQYGLSIRGESAGSYPILRMNCQVDGEVSLQDLQYVDIDERTLAAFALNRGDILFNRTNSYELVGRSAVFDHDVKAVFASYLVRLAVDRTRVDPHFLNFLINWDVAQNELKKLASRGVSQANISASKLKEFSVHLPSLREQKSIAQVLRKVRGHIVQEFELEDRSRSLKLTTLSELFTRGMSGEAQKETEIGPVPESWDVVDFKSVREWLQYGTSVHCSLEKKRYPVLRIPNVEPGRVDASELKYCDLSDDEAAKYLLRAGDLLFIRTNGVIERLGACAVYRGDPQAALFASYLIRARLKDSVDPRYVAYFYGSALGTSLVAGRATPAADGKYNLNTGTIDSLPLPLPPNLEVQHEIVTILDALDRKIELHQKRRAILEELFKALLHKLMTGELRVDQLTLSALDASQPQEAVS
ncbi:MAG: restriction endonuclease subunit S [Myxococcus sp.]|nr:restriction endonuclease subunit S [Myxococcus sp.]